MNATAQPAAASSSSVARSSEPGLREAGGTIRSRWPGQSRRFRFRASRSSPATSASFALPTPEPPPDQDAAGDERRHSQEPGHEALRDRAEVTDRPAAAVVRALRVLDVADDRVHL